jgi:hypothetical protein
MIIRNAEGEGLNYWANMPPYGNGTAGYAQIRSMSGALVKSFQGDFGREVAQSFTVGMTIDVPELHPGGYVNIYPNPTPGRFEVSMILGHSQLVSVVVHDVMGHEIYHNDYQSPEKSGIQVDLTAFPAGIYLVTVFTETGSFARKVVKY